jgi:hypothetical protein
MHVLSNAGLRVASTPASDVWVDTKDVRVLKVSAWRGVPSSSGDPFITQKMKGSLTPRIERVLAAAFTLVLYLSLLAQSLFSSSH